MTLKHLHDPFYIRHPENTYVEAFFCVFGVLVFGWSLFYKFTLTATVITVWYLPFLTRVYPIAGIDEIKSMSKRSAVIRFHDGRKILVAALLSGGPFFLADLGSLMAGRPRHVAGDSL
jgi:hypothetical protein